MSAPAPALRTRGLTKRYGRTVGIEDLDLDVREGEIFGFLGPNGAGKTTTLRLILGLVRATGGRVEVLGRDLRAGLPGVLEGVGYLPGDFGLYGGMTGHALLEHLLRLRCGGRAGDAAHERLEALKRRFPIDYGRPVRTWSKGMRQIAGILQAAAHAPRLLVLDEPTSGLDPLMQERVLALLREHRRAGRTVFFSSHGLREVERVCDRVGIVREGRLLAVQDVGEYRARLGKHVFVAASGGLQPLSAKLRGLAGTRDLRVRDGGVELHYGGPVAHLLRAVAPLQIDDFLCQDPDIEDFFLQHYRGGSPGGGGRGRGA